MTRHTFVSAISAAVVGLTFHRRGARWYRRQDDLTEVISLQRSKAGDAFLIELGVFDPQVFQQIWPTIPKTVTEADCAVRVRLNELGNLGQVWFDGSTEEVRELSNLLKARGVPWLESMHSEHARIDFLRDRTRSLIPVESVMLALTEAAAGESETARRRLSEVHDNVVGPWRGKIAKLLAELDSTAPNSA